MKKSFYRFLMICTVSTLLALCTVMPAFATKSSSAKEVFAGITVTVNDEKNPATYSGGTDWPITTYYFFSADSKKLGSISGKALMAISDTAEYRASHDPGVWLADMFNEYRGLGTDSRKTAQKNQLEEFRSEVIRLTNLEREKAGLPAFEISDRAMKYAQTRAEELAVLYSHKRPDGTGGGTENIAKGQLSPKAVVQAWMDSSGHRKNIQTSTQTHLGIGCYKDGNGTLYWVQVFDCNPAYYSE